MIKQTGNINYSKAKPIRILLVGLVFVFTSVLTLSAQNPKISSLESRLKTSKGTEKFQILMKLSQEYEDTALELSLNYAEQAVDLASGLKDDALHTDAIGRVGLAYMSSGYYGKSLEFLLQYLKKVEKEGNKRKLIFAFNNVGLIYKLWGDYNQAIEYNLKALKSAEETNDTLGKILAHNNIGMIYTEWQKYDKAIENLNNAYNLSLKYGDKLEIIRTLINLGTFHTRKKSISTAQAKYFEAIRLAEEIGKKHLISKCYFELGNIALNNPQKFAPTNKEKYSKALDFFKQALQQNVDVYNKLEIGKANIKIGQTYLKQEEYKLALDNLNEGIALIQGQNYRNEMKDAYQCLAEVYLQKKDFKQAYEYLKKYSDLRDSIFSDDNGKKISEMAARIETEKKEKDIQIEKKKQENATYIQFLLIAVIIIVILITIGIYYRFVTTNKHNKDLQSNNEKLENANKMLKENEEALMTLNANLATMNEKLIESEEVLLTLNANLATMNEKLIESEDSLSKSNATKDKFFSIIAHDLKNPIQGILLSTELLQQFERMRPEVVKKQVSGVHETTKYLSTLLNNLLNWARSQSNKVEYTPMINNIYDIVEDNIMLHLAAAEKKSIYLHSTLPKQATAYCDFNTVNTVIRNLISNALKFTPENGSISINCEYKDDELVIIIEDTGVGIPEENLEKLFKEDVFLTTKGTAKEAGTGLGLILCKEFISLNKGKIWVESTVGVGTKFCFTLPI